MSAADWVERAYGPGFSLTPAQRTAVEVLCAGLGSPWNIPISWHRVDWSFGLSVSFVVQQPLSTFDRDSLTKLVIAAHDRCMRVSLEARGYRYLGIAISSRKGREGAMHDRHPTIEQAIAAFRGGAR